MFVCGLIFQKLTFAILFNVFNDFVAIVCIFKMTFQFTEAIVTLATFKIDKLVIFYTDFIGIKPAIYIPNVYAEFQFTNLKLGIFKPKQTDFSEFENSAKSKMSLCLEVSNLESAIAHLTALGYSPPGAIITASHGREIYAYDPDGNRIILHQSN